MNRARWEPAYIGVGSNLGEPVEQVASSLEALGRLQRTRLLNASTLVLSAPLGPADQPDYVNAVAALLTQLSPGELLAQCQRIEARQGRRRDGERWGPRTLDLDVLVYGEHEMATDDLTIPHPELPNRAFVVGPLQELAPRLKVPGLGRVFDLARRCDLRGLRAVHDADAARVPVVRD